MISKFHERNIANGKNLLIFAILFAIIIRVAYFFLVDSTPPVITGGGYLWKPLAPIFANPIYSILASSVVLGIMAFVVNHINANYAFIRVRTLLPSAILLLLFSSMPSQLYMSPHYIAALVLLLIVSGLFEAYDLGLKQGSTYKASFYLSLGSLFVPVLLLYFPVLWICLVRVKSFNLKSFLVSLFSIFILYVPVFSYFLFTNNVATFTQPFTSLVEVDWSNLPVLTYSLPQFVILGISVILIFLVLADNSIHSFKDKIRVRAFIVVLSILFLFSVACTLFLNFDTQSTLYIVLALGSLKLAHLFALAPSRIMVIVFFISLLILIVISTIPFYISSL